MPLNKPLNIITPALLALLILPATILQAKPVSLPAGLINARPGKHLITVQNAKFEHAKQGVRAMVYVPAFKTGSMQTRPTIVFYHGNTGNRNYYKDKVGYMIKRANRDGFTLISVQNWWSFSGYTEAIRDSRRATNLLLWQLVESNLIRKDAVYTTGFSAGGLAAMLAVHNSLDEPGLERTRPDSIYPYAGFGSFKGNFYAGIGTFVMNPLIELDDDGQQKHYRKMYAGKLVYITVGGKKDAARVQKQAPEARDFFRDYLGLGDQVIYKQFPAEPHNFPDTNWNPFWQLVLAKLN